MKIGYRTGYLRSHAFKMAARLPPSERQPPKVRRAATLALTDDQIVEVRRRHEHEGVGVAQLAREFGIDQKFLSRVLSYAVRPKLFPPLPR